MSGTGIACLLEFHFALVFCKSLFSLNLLPDLKNRTVLIVIYLEDFGSLIVMLRILIN